MCSDNDFELLQNVRCYNKITIAIDFKSLIAQEGIDFKWNIFIIKKIILRLPIPCKRKNGNEIWFDLNRSEGLKI